MGKADGCLQTVSSSPPGPESDPARYSLQGPFGPLAFRVDPIAPPTRLTVLAHLDGLSREQWDWLKTRLEGLLPATKEWGDFSLIVVSQGVSKLLSNIWRQAQLRTALSTFSPAPLPEGAQEWKTYTEITNNLPDPSSPWEALVIIAALPGLSNNEFKFHTEAFLSYLGCRKRSRLSYWQLPRATAAPTTGATAETQAVQGSDLNWKRLTAGTGGSAISSGEDPPFHNSAPEGNVRPGSDLQYPRAGARVFSVPYSVDRE